MSKPRPPRSKVLSKEGDLLLIKASRAARFERIADLFRNGEGAGKTECFIT